MTAIVNNARFSSNRGGNFQCSFLSFLSWRISHHLNVNDNYCPPVWMGALNFVFFFSPWNLMCRSRSRVQVVTEAHNKGGGVFFLEEKAEFRGKKGGQESKWEWHLPSAEACFVPAIDAPFPKVSLRGGRSALQMCSAPALFTSGQAGRGKVPTHTPSVIPPPDKCPTPTLPPNFSSPKGPQS